MVLDRPEGREDKPGKGSVKDPVPLYYAAGHLMSEEERKKRMKRVEEDEDD